MCPVAVVRGDGGEELRREIPARGGRLRRLLAQMLLEVHLEPTAQFDQLRIPLELVGDVVEAAVV